MRRWRNKKDLIDLLGNPFVNDVVKKLSTKHQAKKQTIIYGELEDEISDIIIPKTEHELNVSYIEEVVKLL